MMQAASRKAEVIEPRYKCKDEMADGVLNPEGTIIGNAMGRIL
jgi:hypothetical protein